MGGSPGSWLTEESKGRCFKNKSAFLASPLKKKKKRPVFHSHSCALWPDDFNSSCNSYRTSATWTAWLRSRSTRNKKASAASNWAVRNKTWKYRKGCCLAKKWDSPVRRQRRTFIIKKKSHVILKSQKSLSCAWCQRRQVPHLSQDYFPVILLMKYHPSLTSVRNMEDLLGASRKKKHEFKHNSIKWLLSHT